jgi:hypothetical protein
MHGSWPVLLIRSPSWHLLLPSLAAPSYNILNCVKLNRSTHILTCLSDARKIRVAYLCYSRRRVPRQRLQRIPAGTGRRRWKDGLISTGEPQTDKDGFFHSDSAGYHESTIKDVVFFRAGCGVTPQLLHPRCAPLDRQANLAEALEPR